MMPMVTGMAVAIRASRDNVSRVAVEGEGIWATDDDGSVAKPEVVQLFMRLLMRFTDDSSSFEAGLVGTVPTCCEEGRQAAFGVATVRAVRALLALSEDTTTLVTGLHEVLGEAWEAPFNIAYLLASESAAPRKMLLSDTQTLESLPLEIPTPERVSWGIVDPGNRRMPGPPLVRQQCEKAAEAATILRQKGFSQLSSLRELEHSSLQAALDALPRRFRPLVRHLVRENRNVPIMVRALKKLDFQKCGTIMMMSHDSRKNDWGETTTEGDFIVGLVRKMSLDGLLGACSTGQGGSILIAGQSYMLPQHLDHIRSRFEERFGRAPKTILL